MLSKFAAFLSLAALATHSAQAAAVPTGQWPTSTGSVVSDKPIVVAAGTIFDGKMQTFDRSDIMCQGQKEGDSKQAMFLVEAGATLKNVIIGKNQMEGVHCDSHDCTIENVWWDDVCEDALSIKGGSASSVTKVIGGGARYADDKVIQHNGLGKVTIDGFFADTFGKLYRSCGTCGNKQRTVEVSNVLAKNPKVSLVTVNSNFGDKATLKNIFIESTKAKVVVCARSAGTTNGAEPTKVGDGPDGITCNYAASEIHLNAAPGSASNGTGASVVPPPAPEPTLQPTPIESPSPVTSTPSVPAVTTPTPTPEPTLIESPSPITSTPTVPTVTTPTPVAGDSDTGVSTPTPDDYVPGKVRPSTVPTGEWPTSTGSIVSNKPIVVAAGTVYDGKMQTFNRSDITCQGQKEGGAQQAMFLVEAGATLKNVIIGKNQMEGVHCDSHDCTIENVWWDDVCEDALSIKGGSASSVTKVIGGGARNADDKIIQHNGLGKVTIDGFFADTFGKLYRSCGTCGNKQRTVEVSNVLAKNPKVSLVTVNSNFGDKATLKNIFIESTKAKVVVCARSAGTTNGAEPTKVGDGPDGITCNYAASEIHLNSSV